MSGGAVKAGLYVRRSPRPTESETIERQLADTRGLAASLGWEIVDEYVDKNLSAYGKKGRPEYRRMLADLESGRITAVVASHTNRLYRKTQDLVEFVSLIQRTKAEVRTVMSGHYDLTTAAGRKHAYQAGIDAEYESALLGERVARERKARAAEGKPPVGGRRPFGYAADKVTLIPEEADMIRESAERVAKGGSLWAEALDWNTRGVLTTAGNPWEVSAVRAVLVSPRIAGLRQHRGEVVGEANWPAIIDLETHHLIRAMVASRARGRPRSPSWLLSGLILCHKCGRKLYGSTKRGYRAYACAPGPGTDRGCGGASVSAAACDTKVIGIVEAGLSAAAPRVGQRMTKPRKGENEAEAIEARRLTLAREWAAGERSDAEYEAARAVLMRRLDELGAAAPERTAGPSRDVLLAAWRTGEVVDRRVVVEALVVCPMPLAPANGRRLPSPADRLTVVLR